MSRTCVGRRRGARLVGQWDEFAIVGWGELDVRRQGFWHQELRKLRESLAHLVGFIMRRVVCDASVALRVSFV